MRIVTKSLQNLLFILPLLTACVSTQSPGTMTPISETSAPTSHPSNSNIASTACREIEKIGLPIDDGIQYTHIIYQVAEREDLSRLWLVSLDGSDPKPLKDYPPSAFGIGFLQDGQRFLIATGYGDEAWQGDIDGSPLRKVPLTEDLLANYQPYSQIWEALVSGIPLYRTTLREGFFYSPDNEKVAIWNPGDVSLVILDKASQQKTAIIQTKPHDYIHGSWASDGKWFIFLHEKIVEGRTYNQISMINSDGKGVFPLTPQVEHSFWGKPEISPDNKKVAFYIMNNQGSLGKAIGVIKLGNDGVDFNVYPIGNIIIAPSLSSRSLVWSPDSQWVAFFNDWSDNKWSDMDIHAMNIDTGKLYCVTQDGLGKQLMDWR